MPDSEFYTLAEAAAATGRTVEALRQLIKRGKLRRAKTNDTDGLVRVRLDAEQIAALKTGRPVRPTSNQPVDQSREISSLVAIVATLSEQVQRAELRVDAAAKAQQAAEARTAELEAGTQEATRERERLKEQIGALRAQLTAAESQAAAAQRPTVLRVVARLGQILAVGRVR